MDEILKIKSLTHDRLICETKNLVAQERALTASLLHYLSEIQRRRLYAELGFSSLFVFCVKYLGYTESQAQRRIEAMRAIQDLPQIESKIKKGSLSLTAVAQAQSYFRQNDISPDKRIEVFEKLENKTTRECEKTLLDLSPGRPLPKEKIKPITSTHTQVTLNLPNKLVAQLEKIRGLLSHQNPNMTQAELLGKMADIVLNKIDPQLSKVKAAKSKLPKINALKINAPDSQSQRRVSTSPKVTLRRYLPIKVKKDVWVQAQGQCTFISKNGIKCDSKTLLEVDHKIPLALGGNDSAENLRLLCRAHNQWAAIQSLGKETIGKYLKY